MSKHSAAPCANCGAAMHGPYCAACGQEAHYAHPPTVAHFFHDLTHEILHVDGKIFRTIRALLIQPGLLTSEYWRGHVVSWIRPLRLFLIAAAIHLLVATHGVGPLNLQLRLAFNAKGERDISIVQDPTPKLKAGYRPSSPEEEEATFQKFRKAHSSIRYFSVVGFALFAWLLYYRRQPYFVSHLILGLHVYSFWYLLASALRFNAVWAPIMVVSTTTVYLMLALRRVFGQTWPWTVAKTFALMSFLMVLEGFLGLATAIAVERHWL